MENMEEKWVMVVWVAVVVVVVGVANFCKKCNYWNK
jgi:hypothetical protein